MKKLIGVITIAAFVLIAGIVGVLAFKSAGKDKAADLNVQQTNQPVATAEPTKVPVGEPTLEPTLVPTETPEPTVEPTETPVATETPAATETPEPTKTPEATAAPTETPAVEEQKPEVDYSKLSDTELKKEIVKNIKTKCGRLAKMKKVQRTVYVVSVFENEIKGGLHSYLTGSNNVTAQYCTEALSEVGATQSATEFGDFTDSQRIQLSSTKELNKLRKEEYNFGMFDEEYAEIAKSEDLNQLLVSYIKKHLDELK